MSYLNITEANEKSKRSWANARRICVLFTILANCYIFLQNPNTHILCPAFGLLCAGFFLLVAFCQSCELVDKDCDPRRYEPYAYLLIAISFLIMKILKWSRIYQELGFSVTTMGFLTFSIYAIDAWMNVPSSTVSNESEENENI